MDQFEQLAHNCEKGECPPGVFWSALQSEAQAIVDFFERAVPDMPTARRGECTVSFQGGTIVVERNAESKVTAMRLKFRYSEAENKYDFIEQRGFCGGEQMEKFYWGHINVLRLLNLVMADNQRQRASGRDRVSELLQHGMNSQIQRPLKL